MPNQLVPKSTRYQKLGYWVGVTVRIRARVKVKISVGFNVRT